MNIFHKNLQSKDPFVAKTIHAIHKILEVKEGEILINKIMNNPYTVIIKSGGNRFDAKGDHSRPMFGLNEAGSLISFITKRFQVDRLPFSQWGSGGIVYWDSKKEFMAMESDGVSRATPTFMALAHELYHAYDSVRGILDRRMIKGEGYEFQPVIEYRAVYFENLMRKNHGRIEKQIFV